jgi:hypothetical protein
MSSNRQRRNSFRGRDFVDQAMAIGMDCAIVADWLAHEGMDLGQASTREEATTLGNKLLSAGIIQHTTHRYDFQDRSVGLEYRQANCWEGQ